MAKKINELSKELLKRYVKKGDRSADAHLSNAVKHWRSHAETDVKASRDAAVKHGAKYDKRVKFLNKADSKIAEETEVNELSTKTLKSYTSKAAYDPKRERKWIGLAHVKMHRNRKKDEMKKEDINEVKQIVKGRTAHLLLKPGQGADRMWYYKHHTGKGHIDIETKLKAHHGPFRTKSDANAHRKITISQLKEETEMKKINELSKPLLKRYIAKAAVDKEKHGFHHDDASDKHFRSRHPDKIKQDHDYGETDSDFADRKVRLGRNRDKWQKTMKDSSAKYNKRSKGISTAARKVLKGDSDANDRIKMRKMVKVAAKDKQHHWESVDEANSPEMLQIKRRNHEDGEMRHTDREDYWSRKESGASHPGAKMQYGDKASKHGRRAEQHRKAWDVATKLLNKNKAVKEDVNEGHTYRQAKNAADFHAAAETEHIGHSLHHLRKSVAHLSNKNFKGEMDSDATVAHHENLARKHQRAHEIARSLMWKLKANNDNSVHEGIDESNSKRRKIDPAKAGAKAAKYDDAQWKKDHAAVKAGKADPSAMAHKWGNRGGGFLGYIKSKKLGENTLSPHADTNPHIGPAIAGMNDSEYKKAYGKPAEKKKGATFANRIAASKNWKAFKATPSIADTAPNWKTGSMNDAEYKKGLGSRNEEVDEGYRSSNGQLKNGFKTVKYKMSGLDRYAATKDGVQVGDKSDYKDGRKAKNVANRLARFDRAGRKANTSDDPLGRHHGRNEEVVNEISAGKLGKYIHKSKKDEDNRRADGIKWRDEIRKQTGMNVGTPIDRKLYSPTASREAGRKRAMAKLTGNAKVHATEDVSASLRTGVADRLTKTITGKKGISTPSASGSPKNNPVPLDLTTSAYSASKGSSPAAPGAEDLTTGAYRASRTMESVVNEVSNDLLRTYIQKAIKSKVRAGAKGDASVDRALDASTQRTAEKHFSKSAEYGKIEDKRKSGIKKAKFRLAIRGDK